MVAAGWAAMVARRSWIACTRASIAGVGIGAGSTARKSSVRAARFVCGEFRVGVPAVAEKVSVASSGRSDPRRPVVRERCSRCSNSSMSLVGPAARDRERVLIAGVDIVHERWGEFFNQRGEGERGSDTNSDERGGGESEKKER